MLIDKILEDWEIDCEISEDDLSESARKSPKLHSKYLRILIDYKLKKTKATEDLKEQKMIKSKYFRGLLTTEELKALGWEPYQLRVLKGEVDELVDADADIQKVVKRIEYYNSAIYMLESILTEIKSRSFHARVAMDWVKFRSGG